MYLVGFALLWAVGRYAIKTRPHSVWTTRDLDDALFYGILGTIIGGRLGYVLFYKFGDYLLEPWRIFFVWEGGMSFHGGFLGVIIALCVVCAQPSPELACDHRFHRTPGAAGARRRPSRQLYQRRAVGSPGERAVGDDFSQRRPRSAPPVAAL